MAGHSQFKNIMFRKGKQDKERVKALLPSFPGESPRAKSGMPARRTIRAWRTAIIRRQRNPCPRTIPSAPSPRRRARCRELRRDRYEGRGPGGTAIIIEP